MRRLIGLAVVAIGAAGCGDGPAANADAAIDAVAGGAVDATVDAMRWPALWFDVAFNSAGYLSVSASDPARTACTFYNFLRSGCEDVSDFYICGQGPLAPWITAVRVLSGTEVIATDTTVDIWEGAAFGRNEIAGHDDLVLVIEASDGQRAEIPMPTGVVPPQPTIATASYDGTTLHVTWSAAPPAASTMIQVQGGTRGYRCHVAAPQAVIDLPWLESPPNSQFGIATYAAAPPIATPLGEARVWIGASASAPVPAPPPP